ncbi:MAG: polysaccharide deacetylase family protein [Eubacteriales bacterium]|nr:polysaccharide deacetylase family protein [Eubacteriales bacterium]
MKKLRLLSAMAVSCALLMAQPVFAAGQPFAASSSSPVIVVGGSQNQSQPSGGPGVSDSGSVNPSAPGGNSAAPDGGASVPVLEPAQGDGQTAPPGDAGTVLVPVGQENTAAEPVPGGSDQGAAAQGGAGETAPAQTSGRHVDPSKPMVALTFDDGPQPSVGNRIMDCLAQYGGKATFFMVGERVGSYKTEVQRMVAEGHEVANHSMNHKYFQKLGAAEIQAQVNRANDAIEAACGVRPKLMRLPGGNVNSTVKANVHMPMIQWSIDTLDWKTRNADKTVAAVLNHVKDGDIVLMHELYSQTGDAALRIIPELVNRGYQLVTVSELAAAKGKSLEAGKLYSSFR